MNRRSVKIYLIFGLILLIFMARVEVTVGLENNILIVDDKLGSGPDNPAENFTSIQDALEAAKPGDSIKVYQGEYFENIVINKSISLIGQNKYETIIDGGNFSYTVLISSSFVNLENFSIRNSDIGICVNGQQGFNNIMLIDNSLNDCKLGIFLQNSTHNNTLSYNEIYNNSKGIRLYNSSNNYIFNNELRDLGSHALSLWERSCGNNISNNFIYQTSGINLERWSNSNVIYLNHITEGGISLDHCFDNLIMNNTISNCRTGIGLSHSSFNGIFGNEFKDNELSAIFSSNSENNIIENNTYFGNSVDIKERPGLPRISFEFFLILLVVLFVLLIFVYKTRIHKK